MVKYKISVFGSKAKMPVLSVAEMLVLSIVEMPVLSVAEIKPAKPVPSVVEVYPCGLPQG